MTFGTLYANWSGAWYETQHNPWSINAVLLHRLVLIHSEFVHPWDGLFRCLGALEVLGPDRRGS